MALFDKENARYIHLYAYINQQEERVPTDNTSVTGSVLRRDREGLGAWLFSKHLQSPNLHCTHQRAHRDEWDRILVLVFGYFHHLGLGED